MFARSLALATLCAAAFSASAVTVDLRHEFIDGGKTDKTNADRVSVSHRFANGFGFSVEAKWKSGGDNTSQPYSDLSATATKRPLAGSGRRIRISP